MTAPSPLLCSLHVDSMVMVVVEKLQAVVTAPCHLLLGLLIILPPPPQLLLANQNVWAPWTEDDPLTYPRLGEFPPI